MAQANLTPSENQVRGQEIPELKLLLPPDQFDLSLWQSLRRQIHDWRHPETLPPLRLTSKPVPVREIWGAYNYKKRGAVGSTVLHVLAIGGIIAVSVAGARVVKEVKHETVTLIAPDISQYMPLSSKKNDTIGGGGGGGDRDKLPAPKGKLPKFAMEQFTPPAMVIRNDHPKLPMEPTVVVPPQVKMAQLALPNFGDPKSAVPNGPPS
ncbi:MAG: hypothetical protein ACHP9S_11010, partial [Terriglobales bacterium]